MSTSQRNSHPEDGSWLAFPDPRKGEYLTAPLGPGVYVLRRMADHACLYVGEGASVAQRMCSLLPKPHGHGTRNNSALRNHVLEHLVDIEYRTVACESKERARTMERELIEQLRPRFNLPNALQADESTDEGLTE